MERDRALELIIAGGLVAIGCAAGAPVTSLVNAIGGVGGNWAADLAINGYRTTAPPRLAFPTFLPPSAPPA